MIKKLRRHGNSLAIVLDRPVLDLLNITADTPISITTDGKSLILSPVTTSHAEQLSDVLEEINTEYGDVLKKLAG
ncbi:MAG: AbrB/MazE/SpoVT family DNA-binding domain-containing protein [Armatimonadota bacterium]